MNQPTIRIIGIALCTVLLSSLAVAPVTAQTAEEAFLVELDSEGDADVSLSLAYDLESDEKAAAFEELRENATARTQVAERFENRMNAVAADAGAASDREMSVGDGGVELHRNGDTGLVVLSVEWTNIAAVEDDRLTATEPFASGFEPDRTFTVTAPDGYTIISAEPEPTDRDGAAVSWAPNTSLDGFEVVAEPAEQPAGGDDADAPDEGAIDDAAGFGIAVGVLALLAAALLSVKK